MPTVFITGANRGLGFGFARCYLEFGWHVIATCRDPEKAKELKGLDGNLDIYALDVIDHDAIDVLAKKLMDQPIDVLINNAGILGSPRFEKGGPGQRFGEMDYAGFRQVLEVNTLAPLKMVEAFVEHVAASTQRKIVTMSTAMGSLALMEQGFIAYRTSKAAVNAIMRNIAIDLKQKGIVSIHFHPGWVKTDMGTDEAPLELHESIHGLINQIEKLDHTCHACFRNYEGEEIPW